MEFDKEGFLKEVLSAIKPLLTDLQSSVKEYVDGSLAPIEAAITEPPPPPQKEEPKKDNKPTDEMSILKAQKEELTSKLQESENKAFNASLDNHLSEVATSKGVIVPSLFKDVVKARYGSSVTKNGDTWYIKNSDGSFKDMSKALDEFFTSNEGLALLPPESQTQGSGTTETATNNGNDTNSPKDTEYIALHQSFLQSL